MTDYYYVDCEEYREALSARLDDEEGPDDARHPADHLEHCAGCALWYDNAALITRRTRTTAAVAWPDVADAVLARVRGRASADTSTVTDTFTGTPAGPTRLRVALGAVGVVQGATALFSLTGTGDYQAGAWNLALAVAFGAVAAGRHPPAGLVPLLGTFVGVLSWGHVSGHAVSATGVLPFLLSALGLVLVVLLARTAPPRRGPVPPPGGRARVSRARPDDGPADGMRCAIRGIVPTKAACGGNSTGGGAPGPRSSG